MLSTLSHILYSSQESNIPQLTHSVVCRQDKWRSTCSNRTVSLTTRFVTVFVSSITFFPSGKSLSSAALALSGPLTSLVPLITFRTLHILSLKKPYHHTLCRYSAIFVSALLLLWCNSILCSWRCVTLHAPPLWRRPPTTTACPKTPCWEHGSVSYNKILERFQAVWNISLLQLLTLDTVLHSFSVCILSLVLQSSTFLFELKGENTIIEGDVTSVCVFLCIVIHICRCFRYLELCTKP